MKYIIAFFLSLGFTAASFSFECDYAVSQLSDASNRHKCMYKMLSHWIQVAEIELLENYKVDLGTSQAHAGSRDRRHHAFRTKALEDLKLYYGLREKVNPEVQDIFITNKASIPMTCR